MHYEDRLDQARSVMTRNIGVLFRTERYVLVVQAMDDNSF